jgi:outer membrane receptor protein involved in Fe transport
MTASIVYVIGSALAFASVGALGAEVAVPGGSGDELSEILVTAEKTSEPLSKTPISISAISSSTLQEQHITDYEELSRAVPNLSYSSSGGPGQSNIEIRGVASQAGSATTGIYLDDVPIDILNIYTSGATEPRFFDVDRIEVLRGPQGTLYGSSSMGGTIHFVSNAPDLHAFSGSAHGWVSDTRGGSINGEADSTVNLPIIDGVAALRVGTLLDHESGWIDRNAAGAIVATKINEVNTAVVRATLDWRPFEGLSVEPSVYLQRIRTGGQDTFGLSLPEFQSPTLLPEKESDQFAISSVTVKYDVGWADLTAVTGYFWRVNDRKIDGTYYDSAFIGGYLQSIEGFGGAQISALPAPVQFNTNINQFHQEIRLASKPAGPEDHWSWLGGLYYSRARTGLLDNEYIPGFNTTFESLYNATPLAVLGAAFPNDLVYNAFTEFVNAEEAVFGQATYQIISGLKVTAGARYERATEELSFNSLGYFASGAPYEGSAKGYKTTPKAVISYEMEKTMVYASAAEGFRDGGINRPVPVPLCSADLASLGLTQAPPAYKSDSLWSYELGAKSHALADAVSLSGSLFDIRWNNIQTDIILPTCTFDIKDNIGSAENRGAELELAASVTPDLKLSVGGNFTDARITQPVTILGVERGDHVPGVPRYQFSSAVDYGYPMIAEAKGRLNLNAQWVGPSQGTIFHSDPDFSRPAYFVMGGSAGMQWQRFDVTLFVTNLLDQHKVIQRPNIALVEYGVTVRPRTVGLSGNYSF